ncbi:Type-2Aa cytolytic delta-endotoxin [Streptomyces sp. NPDC006482]|uniref:Type-2Aa cytolytic delta-endotoxin n=1 Tax=unclassified Streptomyces TaxID=2593676 RepID=UPI002256AAC8|nr:Type-2Aa cytolytic delta-endotoxin [Streptomyces sp. NBC_00094]MCX5394778.1 Type-2Aa cytolytic delta-endotoxin [Streptomyces sp. NBC_00094]
MAASFRTVVEVGPDHLDQARSIDRVFQEAIAPATVNFDFEAIREAAAAVPDSTVVRMVRGWGLQEHAPVLVMVLSLKEAVRQALPPEYTDAGFWETVERELVQAFTGLAAQEGQPGLSFYEESEHRTRFYRDLFFALQDEGTGDDIYALAFCVDVTIELPKAQATALELTDVVPFGVRLNAIVLRQAVGVATGA